MNTKFAQPASDSLRRAIANYAFITGEGLKPKILRPRTASVLSIRLAGGASVDNHAVPSETVGGVHDHPYTLVPTEGYVDFVRVQFTTGGLRYFSRVPAASLRERSVSADQVFPYEMVSTLLKELRASREVEDRVDALDRFFTMLYSPLSQIDRMIIEVAEQLTQETSKVMSAILERTPVSLRQIERLFADLIGFSPRKLVRVSRFERAAQLVLSNDSTSFSDIALETGYYDQAHFNRDFKQFISMPPSSYSLCPSP